MISVLVVLVYDQRVLQLAVENHLAANLATTGQPCAEFFRHQLRDGHGDDDGVVILTGARKLSVREI
jgi:hypothetical protein